MCIPDPGEASGSRSAELSAFYSEDPDREVLPGETELFYGHVEKGFEYPMLKFAVISEGDIFGAPKKKKRKIQRYEGTKIRDFGELKVGDYVVHETHGLGIYQGIEKVEMEGTVRDYMKISYRDGGNLYVLATGLDAIQKYASADAAKKPKLNKLGTQEWHKTKTRVRAAVDEVAKDLVELYAARQNGKGYAFSDDTVWQREFEEMFPFEETDDQLMAIAATKRDMESNKIMDRLICGDVGYGKTEVAIRAAFKAVQDGKQVVFLVPTTILAQQHYNTFVQRMKDYPIRIEQMSRFRTPAQQKKVIEDLKKGLVDIVIGTHRVLSSDMQYKDLGLLMIDEEQRFGVTHKEKIKKMKENVDVLTLTATPIPRTLHMSLVGIRDMSVLEEAPEERQPIQTYVMEYNEEMVREAITRELSRNGQVYYVYNRVTDADAAREAVIATQGEVLSYQGNIVEAYYFSTSMGYTAAADVWNVEDPAEYGYLTPACLLTDGKMQDLSGEEAFLAYIQSPADGYDSDCRYFRWRAEADYHGKTDEVNSILLERWKSSPKNINFYPTGQTTEIQNPDAASVEALGEVTGMSAAERGSSGALLAVKITYEKGSALVRTEYNIRKVLGACAGNLVCADGTEQTDVTMLPSAFFAITKQGDGGMVLYGGGYGHGLGMSQNAANGMAKAGMNYEEILQYFYNDVKLETMK